MMNENGLGMEAQGNFFYMPFMLYCYREFNFNLHLMLYLRWAHLNLSPLADWQFDIATNHHLSLKLPLMNYNKI